MDIRPAKANEEHWNPKVRLPYGLRLEEIKNAVADVYQLLHTINQSLIVAGQRPIEEIVLGNTFSGMLSEFVVKSIDKHSKTLCRNEYVGGHPDMIPRGTHPKNSILRCPEGLEVKTSRQSGGWQGHNPECCWIMIFRYKHAALTQDVSEREPTRFVEILCAKLEESDWSLAERGKKSRRTRTVSINSEGVKKLRENFVYRDPAYSVRKR